MTDPLPTFLAQRSAEAAQTRFAMRIAAALSERHRLGTDADIDTRLRFAREQALAVAAKARNAVVAGAPALVGVGGGAALLGRGTESNPWWLRLGSLLPLAVLLAGLALIDSRYASSQIEAAVEVDSAILADALPPEAYRDQGFVEYLKTARR